MVAIILTGCNTSRNNAATRNYQAFLTRFNIQYHGDKHYDETLEDMEKNYEDDYDAILPVHPSHARLHLEEMPQPSGDFSRSIEKAQKAIQLHSIKKPPRGRARTAQEREWKSRSEYNPYLHNSWLLMGKSIFMQGDFRQAAAVFFYISQHFKWLPSIVAEARAWEARCYCALGEFYDAENILSTIKFDNLKTKEQKESYYLASASVALERSAFSDAVKFIDGAIACSSASQKTRLKYLKAQVLSIDHRDDDAYKTYKELASNILLNYDTRIKARTAMSNVTPKSQRIKEISDLKKLLSYASNAKYKDRIFYAIGNLLALQGDTLGAIESFKDAIESVQASSPFDAQIELSLGKLLYEQAEYVEAQPHYLKASTMLPATYPDLTSIIYRSNILDKYSQFARNIELQDSLLNLASLGEEKCMEICERLAAEYRKAQEEAEKQARDAEYLASGVQNSLSSTVAQPMLPAQSGDAVKWYFYNPQLVENGKVQFQRIWGNRRLEDDWRRSNKTSFRSFGQGENDEELEEDEAFADTLLLNDSIPGSFRIEPSSDPADAMYYYVNIPFGEPQKKESERIVADGLYGEGVILKNDIGNLPLAEEKFNLLLKRFPDSELRMETLNELFLINARINNFEKADSYRRDIAGEFPETSLGKAMKHSDYLQRQKNIKEISDSTYTSIYNDYINMDYPAVHRNVKIAVDELSGSSVIPNILFVDALAYAADKETEEFKDRIQYLLKEYPETDLTQIASSILNNLEQGKNVQPTRMPFGTPRRSSGYMEELFDGMDIEEMPIDSTLFLFEEKKPHYVVLHFPIDSVNPNELLYNVALHNFTSFMSREFDLLPVNENPYAMLVIQGLYNKGEAQRYIELLLNDKDITLDPTVILVPISENDYNTMRNKNLSLSEYLRYADIMKYDKGYDIGINR